MIRTGLISPLLLVSAVPAAAQQTVVRPMTVNVSVHTVVKDVSAENPDMLKAQAEVRRNIYQVAGRECTLLLATIASACEMKGVNISLRDYGGRIQPPRLDVRGNLSYTIIAK